MRPIPTFFQKPFLLAALLLFMGISTGLWGQPPTDSQYVHLSGTVTDVSGRPLAQVHIEVQYLNNSRPNAPDTVLFTDSLGRYSALLPRQKAGFRVWASSENAPLAGIDTWDMILMARHIMGLQPFSQHTLVCADVNHSKTLTVFDLLTLRKLVLGEEKTLPHNRVWTFYDKAQATSISDAPDGFSTATQVTVKGNVAAPTVDFTGFKMGDVGSAPLPVSKTARRTLPLTWEMPIVPTPAVLTVPICYKGEVPLDGIQLALRFDPSLLQLISPSSGTLEGVSSTHFGLNRAAEGQIGFSWNLIDPIQQQAIQPRQVLFYLSFAVKGALPDATSLFSLANDVVPDGAWANNGEEYSLMVQPQKSNESLPVTATMANSVAATPNPTSDGVHLSIESERPGKATFALTDAFGQTLFFREIALVKGAQQLEVPELRQQPTGVYAYWIKLPNGKVFNERIVKK